MREGKGKIKGRWGGREGKGEGEREKKEGQQYMGIIKNLRQTNVFMCTHICLCNYHTDQDVEHRIFLRLKTSTN